MKLKIFFIISILLSTIIVFSQVQNREHYIHFSTFQSNLSSNLDPLIKGYQYTIGDETGSLYTNVYGDRRSENDNGGTAASWFSNSEMMGASVAKMVGTVACMMVLEDATIPGATTMNDKLQILLQDYIPSRWVSLIDGNEGLITLRHLLNHRSGFPQANPPDPQVTLSGTMNANFPIGYTYANPNMDLACFMAMYLANPITMAALESSLINSTDAVYDATMKSTIRNLYRGYILGQIFTPAGINVTCGADMANPSTVDVYAYSSPNAQLGSDIGNIITCMSNGLIWSTDDMTNFVQSWTNPQLPGNLLTAESVALINDFAAGNATTTPLGWNRNADNNVGEAYAHGGLWTPSNDTYRSRMILTQDNTIICMNANSDPSNGLDVGTFITNAYNAAVCAPNIGMSEFTMKKYNSAQSTIVTDILSPLTIDTGDINVFKAGDSVTLRPGFTAEAGSVFRAYIDSCGNLPTE